MKPTIFDTISDKYPTISGRTEQKLVAGELLRTARDLLSSNAEKEVERFFYPVTGNSFVLN